jgi:uncharacterized C2H2 Zn-finger protein
MSRLLRSKNFHSNSGIYTDPLSKKQRVKSGKQNKNSNFIINSIIPDNNNCIESNKDKVFYPSNPKLTTSPSKNVNPVSQQEKQKSQVDDLIKLGSHCKVNQCAKNDHSLSCEKDSNNNVYDPRILKTVDPNFIINNSIMDSTIRSNVVALPETVESFEKKISLSKNNEIIDNETKNNVDFFLNDSNSKNNNNSHYFNFEPEFVNPHYYQEYRYDDSFYTQNIYNKSFDLTSYELDSNITSSNPNSNHQNDENINPIFFHNTPSPNNKNSIRIITSSNRIKKLKDKKLIQAIHKSLNMRNNNGKHNLEDFSNFKTLNNNHNNYLNSTTSLLSSPRKEINESLTNEIYCNQELSQKIVLTNSNSNISHETYNHDKNYTYSLALKNIVDNDPNLKIISGLENDLDNRDIVYMNNTNNELQSKKIYSIKREIKWKKHGCYYLNNTITQINKVEHNIEQSNKEKLNYNVDYSIKEDSFNGTSSTKKFNENNRNNNTFISTTIFSNKDKDSNNDKSNNDNNTSNNEIKDCDAVLEIFRESLKKNKSDIMKTRKRDRLIMPTPKITKLKIRKANIINGSEYSGSEFEEKDVFKCVQCPKVFKQRSQWKRHVDCIHLKIAKFVCIKCNKAFKRSDHLKNHIRRIHGS